MAVLIPNAGDTTSGNKYESLDQAEPDALDFELIGNAYSGVLAGCVVTSNASATNVAVTGGTIVIDGVPFTVAANATLALPAAPSDNRFDLVVARVTGGTANLTVVSGDDSGTNPSFPKSTNLITGAGSPSTNIDFSTDVVLASLYRTGSSSVTSSRIVDKRAIRNSGIMFQGTGVPSLASGTGPGNFYFDRADQDGVKSGVYVQRTDGSFVGLAADVGAHFPVGGVFAWPVSAPTPAGCLDASGQGVSTDSYPALFGVYGYSFGGSGGTFNMPQLNDERYLLGTSVDGTIGTTNGTNSYTLTSGQLPSHRHSMAHTHTLVHDHSINHNHGSQNSSSNSGSYNTSNESTISRMQISGALYNQYGYRWRQIIQNGGWATSGAAGVLYGDLPGVARIRWNDNALWDAERYYMSSDSHSHTVSGGSHNHSVNLPNYSGTSGGASNTTTSGSSNANTGYQGSGDAINNRPKSQYVKWLIRASLGDDPSYTGGTPAFEAAYQEVFVVELYAEGESVAADTSLGTSFRMPWPGTITGLRAATGVASDTGPIIIDVNEAGGTLLSTKLTIDQGELTSTAAATPPVISDTVLADDALIEFDVDNGGANAEGPLTVTLYITRSA